MTWLVFSSLICVFVTVSFVDTHSIISRHDYDYPDIERAPQPDKHQRLSDLYQAFLENNKENRRDTENDLEDWAGRWMPDRPDDPTPPPKVLPKNNQRHYESAIESPHETHMGHVSPECDDGKTNLDIDWDRSPAAYTCYNDYIETHKRDTNYYYCEHIPKAYKAAHKCMNQTIEYENEDEPPIYGPHRPLWPVYGEYIYLPKQRWLHSLEHGAIVMLYHPCANPMDVMHLKSLVRQCLWRHIITPYDLSEHSPLALLSWGCRMDMPYMDYAAARHFIQKRALRGPEQIADNGQFKEGLLTPANIVTDPLDSTVCPH